MGDADGGESFTKHKGRAYEGKAVLLMLNPMKSDVQSSAQSCMGYLHF